MTTSDLLSLLPFLLVAGTIVVVMLVIAVRRIHSLTAVLTMSGLALAFASLLSTSKTQKQVVAQLLVLDGLGLCIIGLILLAGIVVALYSSLYFQQGKKQREEQYLLLLTSVLGAMVMSVSDHLGAFFLGLELLGVSLYAMIAYQREKARSIEAGIKYFVLASAATAFAAFGIALLYATTGALKLSAMPGLAPNGDIIALAGILMLLVGIFFKLAIVPFHFWSPDVYQGAPAPATACIATISKAGVFAFFLHAANALNLPAVPYLFLGISLLSIFSMFVGNLLALRQKNIKRLLAYSSIAHMGYLLITVLSLQIWAITAAITYLTVYFLAFLAAIGVVVTLSSPEQEAEEISDFQGLYWRQPWLAGVMTLSMFSLAGIPLTGGFIGKFLLVAGGIDNTFQVLIFSLIVSSVIGLYYYLRIIVTMFAPLLEDEKESPGPIVSWSSWPIFAFLMVLLLWIGMYPSPFFAAIEIFLTTGG